MKRTYGCNSGGRLEAIISSASVKVVHVTDTEGVPIVVMDPKFPRGRIKCPCERTVNTSVDKNAGAMDESSDEEQQEVAPRRSKRIAAMQGNLAEEEAREEEAYEEQFPFLDYCFHASTDDQVLEAFQAIEALPNNIEHQDDDEYEYMMEEGLNVLLCDKAQVTRLCSVDEHTTENGIKAFKKEFKALVDNQVLGQPIELSELPNDAELGRLYGILSEKVLETEAPEYTSRVVFLGNRIRIKKDGKLISTSDPKLIEQDDCWVQSAACHESVRQFLSFSMMKGLKTYSCDLRSAYLQSDAGGRLVYVQVPDNVKHCLPDNLQDAARGMHSPIFALQRALYEDQDLANTIRAGSECIE